MTGTVGESAAVPEYPQVSTGQKIIALHKNRAKFSVIIPKKLLTYSRVTAILIKRVCESTGVLCDEAGDCSEMR